MQKHIVHQVITTITIAVVILCAMMVSKVNPAQAEHSGDQFTFRDPLEYLNSFLHLPSPNLSFSISSSELIDRLRALMAAYWPLVERWIKVLAHLGECTTTHWAESCLEVAEGCVFRGNRTGCYRLVKCQLRVTADCLFQD